jgi:hypothetical protein
VRCPDCLSDNIQGGRRIRGRRRYVGPYLVRHHVCRDCRGTFLTGQMVLTPAELKLLLLGETPQ